MIPLRFTPRIIAGIVALALVVLLLVAGPAACSKYRSMGAQARLEREQTGAIVNSASDAVETQGKANARERASDELTAANEKEIRNAPGADAKVDPAVRDAGIASLCRRPAYSNSERCQLRGAAPR